MAPRIFTYTASRLTADDSPLCSQCGQAFQEGEDVHRWQGRLQHTEPCIVVD